LETLSDTDSEELAALVQGLRAELHELDVDGVEPLAAGEAPEGAKGVELALRDLVVQFVLQPEVLTSDGVRSWLQRQSARSMKLTLVRDSLEVTGVSSEDQDRLGRALDRSKCHPPLTHLSAGSR
jgi:hypothetical protein